MKRRRDSGMTKEQLEHAKRKLELSDQDRAGDEDTPRVTGPLSPSKADAGPSCESLQTRRQWRFGMALLGLSCLILIIFSLLPHDDRRWAFAAFAALTAFAACWFIDRANGVFVTIQRD